MEWVSIWLVDLKKLCDTCHDNLFWKHFPQGLSTSLDEHSGLLSWLIGRRGYIFAIVIMWEIAPHTTHQAYIFLINLKFWDLLNCEIRVLRFFPPSYTTEEI